MVVKNLQVGVLALQGDFREHLNALAQCGVQGIEVRTPAELEKVDALIIPGGESTTIVSLAKTFEVFKPIKKRIAEGMPTYGSCAGMIMLANHIVAAKDGQETFGGIDITVRRNAFGNQNDSFETVVQLEGLAEPMHVAFIRAPIIEQVGQGAEVLATLDSGAVVAVRQKSLLGISFHPEVTDEDRVHKFFIESMVSA
mgnify:CR=1 FL=1